MLNYHPAPGLGDLLPGFFVVPQNPITDTQGTTYVPRIGDILPGSFPVPQNPIKDYMTGQLSLIGRQPGDPRDDQRETMPVGMRVWRVVRGL